MRSLTQYNISRAEMEKKLMRRLDMNKITVHEFFAMNAIDCELVERTVQVLEAYDKLHILNFITRKIIGDTPLTLISVNNTDEIHNLIGLISRPFRGLINVKFTRETFEFKKKSISSREWMIGFREPKEEPKREVKEYEDDIISIGTIKMGDIQLNDIKIKNPNDIMMKTIRKCVEQIVDIHNNPHEEAPTKPVEVKERIVKIDNQVVSMCEGLIYKVFNSCATEKVEITNENLTENVYRTLCNLKQILNPEKFIIRELYISNTGSLIIRTSNNQCYTGVTRDNKIELVPAHEDMFKIITSNKKHMALYVEFTQF